ncbi:MAG: urea transporter [Nitrospinae bacterium]|nr:urea transporter [Nitrospinota bacterium]
MRKNLEFASDAIIFSYSSVVFSDSRRTGLLVLASTLVFPVNGLLGLLGAALSGGIAHALGMDRQSVRKGAYGFNGVLTGLGLGYFFEFGPALLALLAVACIALTFLTVFLNNVFYYYFGLPAMSLPFCLAAWLVMMAGPGLGSLQPSADRLSAFHLAVGAFPGWLNTFFSTVGAVLFQTNTFSGILVSVGVLLYSRIAFVLLAAGFLFGGWVHDLFGADASLLDKRFFGFNHMLTALAIGGIFAVPGPGAFLVALVASAVSSLLLVALFNFLPENLSPLAVPFNISVILTLYALKLRARPSLGVRLTDGVLVPPEKSLGKLRQEIRQWKRYGVAVALPFYGKWKVTQGIDGKYTHREDWRFAYDFQAAGHSGELFKNNGAELEDYFSYGLPVVSPAPGKVAALKDGVADNPVGTVNSGGDRWGNHVIIEHAPGYYSCLAHLKNGSINVKPGQELAKGETVGACGNSGRSPYPHLHLQFQLSPVAGAPTYNFDLSNVVVDGKPRKFLQSGTLAENALVQNAAYSPDWAIFFPYAMHRQWMYRFNGVSETWSMDVDFYGNSYLVSFPLETRVYFLLAEGVLTMKKAEGSRDTGLFFFGSVVSDVPFVKEHDEVGWIAKEGADYLLNPFYVGLSDVFSIAGTGLHQLSHYRAAGEGSKVRLNAEIHLGLHVPGANIPLKRYADAEVVFARDVGVESVTMGQKKLVFVSRE